MQLRGWVFVVCTALVVISFPQKSDAAIFTFGGGGSDAFFVWDGDADVGTMNNDCPPCSTSVLGTVLPSEIVATVSFDAAVEFSAFNLSLLLSVPLSDLPAACGGITCVSAEDFKTTFPNGAQQIINDPAVAVVPQGLAILPFDPLPGLPGPFSAPVTLHLQAASQTFLTTVSPALWATSVVGFALNFGELNVVVPVPFTVELASATAAEPASLLLVGFGLAGVAAARARRRSKTARP